MNSEIAAAHFKGNCLNQLDSHERDNELMAQIAIGNERALAALTRAHSDQVHGLARRFTGNASDAEEIAQEVFWTVWKSAKKWHPGKARFSTWLYRVTLNKCIDWDRRRRFKNFFSFSVPDDLIDNKPGADQVIEDRNNLDVLRSHILKLPSRQRAALLLSSQMERSNKEIAAILEITPGAVEQLLVRARRTLRNALDTSTETMEVQS
ncbi:MAG: sigma-70 family RNA polymerase sigma factor [Stappiaceae bacterium]